jgi:hypothetical protein
VRVLSLANVQLFAAVEMIEDVSDLELIVWGTSFPSLILHSFSSEGNMYVLVERWFLKNETNERHVYIVVVVPFFLHVCILLICGILSMFEVGDG